ncbi:MAG: FAD-dependent oxidoreductase [Edaphobacter sp.]
MNKHVVVVGAGLGGFATAMLLVRRGFKVQVFEKADRIGGRNADLVAGESWEKGFASGAGDTSLVVLSLSIYWLSAAAMVFLFLLLGIAVSRSAACVLYLAFGLQIAWLSRKMGSYRLITAILYPEPLLFYFIIFGRSAWLQRFRRSGTWKGR